HVLRLSRHVLRSSRRLLRPGRRLLRRWSSPGATSFCCWPTRATTATSVATNCSEPCSTTRRPGRVGRAVARRRASPCTGCARGGSAVRFRSPRPVRSAGWLLVAPVLLAIDFGPSLLLDGTDYVDPVAWLVTMAAVAGIALACLIGLALDPRIPIAIACLVVA